MGKALGLIIGIVTLIVSLIISVLLWMMGIPLFFLVFFLPLMGFSFFSWGEKEREKMDLFAPTTIRFCPRCGYQLEGWERYCPVCGYQLRED